MTDLLQTGLFCLLAEPSQEVVNSKMENAYENFITEVLTLNQTETDYQVIFRLLNFTRIELQSLQTQILYGQGEKCHQKPVFPKSNFIP